jgi:hypothetical protein
LLVKAQHTEGSKVLLVLGILLVVGIALAKILFFVYVCLNAEITVVTKEKDDPRKGHSPEYNRLMAHAKELGL